jgi:hypothetical protein
MATVTAAPKRLVKQHYFDIFEIHLALILLKGTKRD